MLNLINKLGQMNFTFDSSSTHLRLKFDSSSTIVEFESNLSRT